MKFMNICLILVLISLGGTSHAPPIEEEKYIVILMPPPPPPPINVEERVNDLSVLHPAFRNKVIRLLHECAKQGIELEVVETYRTPERQDHLRRKGFSMLHGGRSKHQYHLAVDVVPVKWGWYMWHDKELWRKIGKIGKVQGLIWGGDWRRFRDYPHFEYPAHVDSIQYIPIPDTVLIPLKYGKDR